MPLFWEFGIMDEEYISGMKVVPIILMANLFLGIYYTLSLWYKLTDKTRFGAYFALIGAAISLTINIIFIPIYGYMASAIAVLICFISMTVISYVFGQKYFPINYPLKRILAYVVLAVVLFFISKLLNLSSSLVMYVIHTILIMIYIGIVYVFEFKELKKFIR